MQTLPGLEEDVEDPKGVGGIYRATNVEVGDKTWSNDSNEKEGIEGLGSTRLGQRLAGGAGGVTVWPSLITGAWGPWLASDELRF